MRTLSIVGIGRLGGALAIALSRNGFVLQYLIHRGGPSAAEVAELAEGGPLAALLSEVQILSAETILITTDDPQIVPAAYSLMGRVQSGSVVLHASGSLSSEILSDLRTDGIYVGSLHPLVSISEPLSGSESFAGSYFGVEGDKEAVERACSIVAALGGIAFEIDPAMKALYHAAAVTACGHLVALVDVAVEMLTKCGVEGSQAKEILTPLVRSTVTNMELSPLPNALTGSFARGDAEAVKRHIASFSGNISDEAANIYLDLAGRSLKLAEQAGIDPAAGDEIRRLISIAKRNHEC